LSFILIHISTNIVGITIRGGWITWKVFLDELYNKHVLPSSMRLSQCLFIWIAITLLFCNSSTAQDFSSRDSSARRIFFIGLKVQKGFIHTGASVLKPLSHSKPLILQLDLSMLDASSTAWNNCNCYSKTGFSLNYIDFSNLRLGKAYAVSVFLEPYFYTIHKLEFSLRGAAGLAWLTNVYSAKANPDNLFYSSPVSFLLQANANLSYPISPAVRLHVSGQVNHISNGGTRWPNYGINFFTAAAGVEYVIHPTTLLRRPRTPWSGNLKFAVLAFGARHPTEPAPSTDIVSRLLAGVNIGVLKPLTRMNGIGLGAEVYYDPTATVYAQRTGKHYDPVFSSLSFQHAFFFGRLFFCQQLAYTITRLNPNVSQKVYERYFLEYRVIKRIYAGVSLKAYGGTSDHFALALGAIW